MSQQEELIGEFKKEIWRASDSDFSVGKLEGNNTVVGNAESGSLVPGLTYRFVGRWKTNSKHGPSFCYVGFTAQTPASRQGIVSYLGKYCKGIGPRIARHLVDEYGREDAIATLKNHPERCAKDISRLSLEVAQRAAKSLILHEALEQTQLELIELLEGYGFREVIHGMLIKEFGANAANAIREDPWLLLKLKLPGCGFLRVDKLYIELGHPEDSIDRQVFGLWYFTNRPGEGHTWFSMREAEDFLNSVVTGGVRLQDAVNEGIHRNLLAVSHETSEELYLIADQQNARDENTIAEVLSC